MRIFIIEDDCSIIQILEDIIEDCGLGEVCGTNEGKPLTPREIHASSPDVVLVDFLMPVKDGLQVVRELRAAGCRSKIVMLSQVSDKELVARAYNEGIDFFISKPINIVELKSVLRNVEKALQNERTIENIRQMFAGAAAPAASVQNPLSDYEDRLRMILGRLGMAGERGSEDIVKLCSYLKERGLSIGDSSIGTLCREVSPQPKNMEQRLRRAVAVGLSNLAHIGVEDYMNETFETYSSTLFAFEEVRTEMDFIRGKTKYNGKVSLRKFLDGLMTEAGRR